MMSNEIRAAVKRAYVKMQADNFSLPTVTLYSPRGENK
jgi:hypothetical protein